jgi:hypothetical protein
VLTTRNRNGSVTVSALVADRMTPQGWLESVTFYGFTKRAALRAFRAHLKERGVRLK